MSDGLGPADERIRGWVDLVQAPDVWFFDGLIDGLDVTRTTVTARQKGQTVPLAQTIGYDCTVIGRDFDNTLARKFGIPLRTIQLALRAPQCGVSLSSRNVMCLLASRFKGVPSIHFTDNDITAHVDGLRFEELYNLLEATATHSIVPRAFETGELTRWGADPSSVHTYDGYKEDVYIAAFDPEPDFTDQLPFEHGEYVVVRPEALSAAYVDADTIVPDLLTGMVERGLNVVYLSRGRGDEKHAQRYPQDRVYSPETALHGLQLAWHARCVLTGSGTMGREAACMGKPAVSFFPNQLLSVDRELVADGRMYHSRDPDTILDYLVGLDADDLAPDRSRSQRVRTEVLELTNELIETVSGDG